MRKRLSVCLSFIAAMLLCIAMSLCIAACAEDPKNPPVKVSDGTSVELSVGETETFAVADFIAANGSPVTAESSDDAVATAAVAEDILTITAVAAGEADVSLICGEVTVTFDVTITSAAEPMEPVKVKDGEAVEIAFGGSAQRNVADYITAYGNGVTASSSQEGVAAAAVSDGVLTITAVTSGETTVTLTCGSVEVTFDVTVLLPQVGAPVFENGAIAIDLFEGDSGSYTFKATAPEGVEYSYEYTLAEVDANATIRDGVLSYTASQPMEKTLTVNVTATATVSGETV